MIALDALPKEISITSPIEYAQILVSADLGNGRFSDVTRMVKWSGFEGLGEIDNRGLFTPIKDGEGFITASFGNQVFGARINGPDNHVCPPPPCNAARRKSLFCLGLEH